MVKRIDLTPRRRASTARPAVRDKLDDRQWRELKARFKTFCRQHNLPCWKCGDPIDYGAEPQTPGAFEADHYWPRSTHPHLKYVWSNLRAAHVTCNRARRDEAPTTQTWIKPTW